MPLTAAVATRAAAALTAQIDETKARIATQPELADRLAAMNRELDGYRRFLATSGNGS